MISGCATSEGTKNFSKNSQVNQNNFKIFDVSLLGFKSNLIVIGKVE